MNQNRNGANGEASDAFTETRPADGPRLDRSPLHHGNPRGDTRRHLGDLHRHRAQPERRHRYRLPRHGPIHQHRFPGGAAGRLYLHRGECRDARRSPSPSRPPAAQAITATDTANQAIIGTEENFTVSPAPPSRSRSTGFPTTDPPGAPQTFTVTALDALRECRHRIRRHAEVRQQRQPGRASR